MRIVLLFIMVFGFLGLRAQDVKEMSITLGVDEYSVEDAEMELDRICKLIGIRNNYKIVELDNYDGIAKAYVDGNRRYIGISSSGMGYAKSRGKGLECVTVCIMAHELGHHLNNDGLGIHSENPLVMECGADYFMGNVAYRMGYSLEDSMLVLNFMGEIDGISMKGGSLKITHPPKEYRRMKIKEGWNNAKLINQSIK